jgi:hypothetical protein
LDQPNGIARFMRVEGPSSIVKAKNFQAMGIYDDFLEFMTDQHKYADVSDELIEKYAGVFMGANDEQDIIIDIWRKDGFSTYKNGLFSFVNPDDYNNVTRQFQQVSDSAIVFAKSATGCLFIWEKFSFGWAITHLNVHFGTSELVSNDFCMLLEWDLPAGSFWEDECYGEVELKVIDELGPLAFDESYAFVPALALGGSEEIEDMQKVKTLVHLDFLSQLV